MVLILVLGGACAACGRSMSDADVRARLVGRYDLSLGSAASVSSSTATAGTLELDASGRFVQSCRLGDGSTKRDEGEWSYHDARIHFSAFSDCSGVWPKTPEPTSAHLPVEIGDEPIILVSPETNTFYKKLGKRAGTSFEMRQDGSCGGSRFSPLEVHPPANRLPHALPRGESVVVVEREVDAPIEP